MSELLIKASLNQSLISHFFSRTEARHVWIKIRDFVRNDHSDGKFQKMEKELNQLFKNSLAAAFEEQTIEQSCIFGNLVESM